jgi:cytochrome c peroxidase
MNTFRLFLILVSISSMLDGAFMRLEDAVRHHLDVFTSVRNYSPAAAGVAPDLTAPMGSIEPVLKRVDPILIMPLT